MSQLPPRVLTACLPAELLSYVLEQTCPTNLIICGTRTAFLSALVEATSPPFIQTQPYQNPEVEFEHPLSPSREPYNSQDERKHSETPERHPLLIPTLQQISRSRQTTISFIPTVSHLRAYLSVFLAPFKPYQPSSAQEKAGAQCPLLIVYGLLELHRGTSEWSTQGLGNTLATLVEAVNRTGVRLVIVEQRAQSAQVIEKHCENFAEGPSDGDDGHEGLSTRRLRGDVQERGGDAIWYEKLPILSGSVRRAGTDAEYGGRTVEVGIVLKRWFKFGRGEW